MHSITDLFHHQGLRTFLWVWFGSLISFFGTAMTRFALMIWAYQQTGSATTLALLGTANYVPYLLAGPLAGVFVDRHDRRLILLFSDLLAGLVTVSLLLLFLSGNLQIWQLYVAEGLTGLFEAFQVPAYYAAVSVLVPKEQLQRTNGMRALAANGSRVLAPLAAGAVLAWLGISVVMAIDIATFLFSVTVLAVVFIPRPQASQAGEASRGSLSFELRSGLAYIRQRPGLMGLLLVLFGMNVLASLTYFSILPAMILARSGRSEWALGIVQSVLGAGGMVGALLLSTWGGAKRRIDNVLAAGAISFLLGDLLFGLGQSVTVWAVAAFFSTVFIPFISGSAQAIWQLKVEQDLQGRVFALKDTLQQVMMPFGYAAGGLLADFVFEPALRPAGSLVQSLGRLVGTGPGAGMGVMFLFTCVIGTLVCLSGYLFPALRNVEKDLPDVI
jgi:MFS transporter, DHA3 family, macrolide efflux protein